MLWSFFLLLLLLLLQKRDSRCCIVRFSRDKVAMVRGRIDTAMGGIGYGAKAGASAPRRDLFFSQFEMRKWAKNSQFHSFKC